MATDWDKELAKIDKQLESISDDQLLPQPKNAPAKVKEKIAVERAQTSTLGVMFRLVLAVALGVAMLFWPYESQCGLGLAAYLGAVVVVGISGIWTAVWTWRHRSGKAHVLSLLILLWSLVLGAQTVLPRTGYAKVGAPWICK
jgi:membrane protein YdbS with pleckstrin-like domain